MQKNSPLIWHIGGEDVRMRIPMLKALQKRGFRVGAVGSESGEAFADSGIDYMRYDLERWINPLADHRSISQLADLFKTGRPDVVHAFDTKPCMLTAHAAKRAGVTANIRTITGMGYVFSSSSLLAQILKPPYKAMQRAAGRKADRTIFQNPDDRDYFLKNGMASAERSELVLSSGLDVKQFLAEAPDAGERDKLKAELGLSGFCTTILVTRMVRDKGVTQFLQAAKILKTKNPQMDFLLVGPLASEGKQALSQAEIDEYKDCVQYLGKRSDIPALLAISDIFALPSYYREGVPRVLLEAGAMGLALITTDMPGCREAVHHEENGLLVPIRDEKALAQAIEKLAQDYSLRVKYGQASANLIRNQFDLALVADQYATIYKSVLKENMS